MSRSKQERPSAALPSESAAAVSSTFVSSCSAPLNLVAAEPISQSVTRAFPRMGVADPYFAGSELTQGAFSFGFSGVVGG